MTVCIAALADEGKTVVLCSDRSATYRLGYTVSFDSGIEKKIYQFRHDNSRFWLLGAGAYDTTLDVVSRIVCSLPVEMAARDIEPLVTKAYHESRMQLVGDRVLKRYGIASMQEFQTMQHILKDEFVRSIKNEIGTCETGIVFLLVYFDPDIGQFQIRLISGYGESSATGDFFSIGSGGNMAMLSLLSNKCCKAFPAQKVEYLVYEAKKRGEHAVGVGPNTDLKTISMHNDTGTVTEYTQERYKLLDAKMKELEQMRDEHSSQWYQDQTLK